jgi:hypothetical protein
MPFDPDPYDDRPYVPDNGPERQMLRTLGLLAAFVVAGFLAFVALICFRYPA